MLRFSLRADAGFCSGYHLVFDVRYLSMFMVFRLAALACDVVRTEPSIPVTNHLLLANTDSRR